MPSLKPQASPFRASMEKTTRSLVAQGPGRILHLLKEGLFLWFLWFYGAVGGELLGICCLVVVGGMILLKSLGVCGMSSGACSGKRLQIDPFAFLGSAFDWMDDGALLCQC